MAALTLTSLAILKHQYDVQKTYLDMFIPFVAVELCRLGPQFTIRQLQQAITTTFGITIPLGALDTLIKRVWRTDALRYNRIDQQYEIPDTNQTLATFLQRRGQVQREYTALIAQFHAFVHGRGTTHWTPDDAETALLTYVETHAIPLLRGLVEGNLFHLTEPTVADHTYFTHAFIRHLEAADPNGFTLLETVVKGRLLAHVVFYPQIQQATERFAQLTVYLDTVVMLHLLNLDAPEICAPIHELMHLLHQHRVRLAIFQHTYDELLGVLDSLKQYTVTRWATASYEPPQASHLRQCNIRPSDIELIVSTLPRTLARHGIVREETPPPLTELTVDELHLAETIRTRVHYTRDATLERDIQSLTAIFRLRKGRNPQSYESCGSLFVTTNTRLVIGADTFFAREYGMRLPLCVSTTMLATITWLKAPAQAAHWPRKQMIADSYAALNPSDELWRAFLMEIERLSQREQISEDEVVLLRLSADARVLLMDVTHGDAAAVTDATVDQVLQRIKQGYRMPLEQEVSDLQQQLTDAATREQQTYAVMERERQERRQHCHDQAQHIGRWVSGILTVLTILGAGALIVLTTPVLLPSAAVETAPIAWFLPVGGVVIAVLGFVNLVFGVALVRIPDPIGRMVAVQCESLLRKLTHT